MYAEDYKTLRTEKPPSDRRDTLFREGRPVLLERLIPPAWGSDVAQSRSKSQQDFL